MYSHILIRFGELSTKGKNKMDFVRHLSRNIRATLNEAPAEVMHDRIFIRYSAENLFRLKYVFGIQSYSPVYAVAPTWEALSATVLEVAKASSAKTFRISAKRHNKGFAIGSMEINKLLGMQVESLTNLVADLVNPELEIWCEIRKGHIYIFTERIYGLGGYPVGINGRALHLISGGIDSPVAALELMKRGLRVDFINFVTPPQTDESTNQKVEALISLLGRYQGTSVLYRNHFTDLMQLIGLTSHQGYKIILMRRAFYRLASALALRLDYQVLANGESIGQVASQTLEALTVIDQAASLLVIRPLITRDKIDTINLAKQIGSYAISILPANETCELFAPSAPVTKPQLSRALALEAELTMLANLEATNLANNFTKVIVHKLAWSGLKP